MSVLIHSKVELMDKKKYRIFFSICLLRREQRIPLFNKKLIITILFSLVFFPEGVISTAMDESMEIILVRHGETELNKQNVMQGSFDSPLTAEGRDACGKLGRSMDRNWREVQDWFVSPFGRTRETSRLIREKLKNKEPPVEVLDDRLREITCGTYDGQYKKDLDRAVLHRVYNEDDYPFPGGESLRDVMQRGEDFLESLLMRARSLDGAYRAVIISHGTFSRCLAGVISGFGSDFVRLSILDNTGVCRFYRAKEGVPFRLQAWNDTSHLLP